METEREREMSDSAEWSTGKLLYWFDEYAQGSANPAIREVARRFRRLRSERDRLVKAVSRMLLKVEREGHAVQHPASGEKGYWMARNERNALIDIAREALEAVEGDGVEFTGTDDPSEHTLEDLTAPQDASATLTAEKALERLYEAATDTPAQPNNADELRETVARRLRRGGGEAELKDGVRWALDELDPGRRPAWNGDPEDAARIHRWETWRDAYEIVREALQGRREPIVWWECPNPDCDSARPDDRPDFALRDGDEGDPCQACCDARLILRTAIETGSEERFSADYQHLHGEAKRDVSRLMDELERLENVRITCHNGHTSTLRELRDEAGCSAPCCPRCGECSFTFEPSDALEGSCHSGDASNESRNRQSDRDTLEERPGGSGEDQALDWALGAVGGYAGTLSDMAENLEEAAEILTDRLRRSTPDGEGEGDG